jgi:triphosphatase
MSYPKSIEERRDDLAFHPEAARKARPRTSFASIANQPPRRIQASDGRIGRSTDGREAGVAHRQESVAAIQSRGLLSISEKNSSAPREVELKLQLGTGSRVILEASTAFAETAAQHHHQVTTYFDTPDGALSRAGFLLRIRQSGGSHIQTVKSSANRRGVATSRREWEWPIAGNYPDLAHLSQTSDLAKLAQTIEGRLVPVFVTDIARTTRLFHLEDSTIVEAALDEGSIKAGAVSEPVNELELELKEGCLGPMYQLAVELQRLAPMWISTESKSARGWHLRTGQTEGATGAKTPKLGRRVRAGNAFSEIIGETLGHLTSNIAPTLRDDAEGVHQIRTALRTCRAALELFEPRLDSVVVGRFDAELQGFGRLFGAARDWDVFCLQTLPAAMMELPVERLWDLKQVANVERQLAHVAVVDAVRGQSFTAMVLGLAAWMEEVSARPIALGDERMDKRLTTLAPSLLDRVAAKARKREIHEGKLSADRRHSLRKALGKLCDDVKCLSRIFARRKLQRYRDRCEDLRAILGLANDAEVAQRLVRTLVTDRRPDLAKPADALARWSNQRGRKARRRLKPALEDFQGVPVFWR